MRSPCETLGLAIRVLAALTVVGCGDDSGDGGTSVGATSMTTMTSTSADTDGTGDAAGSGSTDEGPYPRCQDAPSCFLAGYDSCILPGAGTQDGFCTSNCQDASSCEAPQTGTATATCEDLSGNGPFCYLECTSGTCPDGMACNDQLFPERAVCFWPPG